jgi:hypothetical protein
MCAAFALGEAAEQATAATCTAMARIVECANAEIQAHIAETLDHGRSARQSLFAGSKRVDWDSTSASVYDATLEIDFFVHMRRRAAAAAVTAAGHLGHAAVLADDAPTALQAWAVVAPWIADGISEPGAGDIKPSPAGYLSDRLLHSAAVRAVLMMASVKMIGPSLSVSGLPGSLGGYDGPCSEAHLRLDWAIGNGSANATQRALREALVGLSST